MPEIEGMELARLLRRFADPPEVVFLTGHADAAVEAFEVQALDFLVKPVTRDRLDAALERVEEQSRAGRRPRRRGDDAGAPPPRRRSSRVDNPKGGGKRLVRLETITYAEADGDYARIHARRRRFVLRAPLGQLEKDWGPAGLRARAPRAPREPRRTPSSCGRSPTAPPCWSCATATEIPVARRNVAALRRRLNA